MNLINMERIFENTATAFQLKTDSQLERAYFLFKMIANEPLVRIGTAVTNFALNAHLPVDGLISCLLYTSPSPRDRTRSRMPSSA